MGDIIRQCPVCDRQIIVENGLFTQHTNTKGWIERSPPPPCPMANRPALSTKESGR